MEEFVMPKCGVYTKEIRPRTVQLLRRQGYFCVLFPTPGKAEPERCILRDIDGSKMVACFADAPAEAQPEPFFADMYENLIDLPMKNIEGKPDDGALTYSENGVIGAAAPLHVNAANIGLKDMAVNGRIRLELWETEGRETAFELYCATYDFGLRALFQPYEIKTFFVEKDGTIKEIDFEA